MEVRLWIYNRWPLWLAELVLLVACWLPAAQLAAQGLRFAGDAELRRLPPVDSPLLEPLLESDPIGAIRPVSLSCVDDELINNEAIDSVVGEEVLESVSMEPILLGCVSDLPYELFGRPYNYEGSGAPEQSGGVIGAGDRMGMLTLGLAQRGWWRIGENHIQFNPVVHFVSGPKQTDMPPRLYDLDISFVRRDTILLTELSYEVALRVGFFSDFEGSASQGLRFPGHAVLYYQLSEDRQFVLGVDYLDRDDIAVLPVVGASFHLNSDLWIEAVFPKPRIAFRVGAERWFYLTARIGGGMWAIERMWDEDDVVTYRDYQVVLGIQQDILEGYAAFLEVGVAFDRQLEYRSGIGNFQPQNTAILRSVMRY